MASIRVGVIAIPPGLLLSSACSQLCISSGTPVFAASQIGAEIAITNQAAGINCEARAAFAHWQGSQRRSYRDSATMTTAATNSNHLTNVLRDPYSAATADAAGTPD